MILPGKHLQYDRALIGIGIDIISALDEDRTVSELWYRVRTARDRTANPITFDWFILALTFLFAISVVNFDGGIVARRAKHAA